MRISAGHSLILGVVLILTMFAPGLDAQQRTGLSFPARAERVRIDAYVGRDGQPVEGLTAADFDVRDDGVTQEVRLVETEEAPLHALLILDTSSSVAGKRLEQLKAAAGTFLDQLDTRDRVTLVTFSHELRVLGGIAVPADSVADVLMATTAAGATSLFDAACAGLLLADPHLGRGVILVFSDGQDRTSWHDPGRATDLARRSDAVVYAVSVGEAEGVWFLQALAAETGGRAWTVDASGDLRRPFLGALSEFRSRYVLEFEPSSERAGWHRLQVRLKRRKADVRARSGYHYVAATPRPAR